jgi:uncharacterized membrane protein
VRRLLWALIAAWTASFGTLALLEHRAFETGRFDLGNMVQAAWSTGRGRPLEMTSGEGEQFVRLGAHFDPILVVFAPWPRPELMLLVQAGALALGALPVFRLAGGGRTGLAWAGAYLLLPALQWTALADFHPVALATPLLLFAIEALVRDRLPAFAVFAGLALLTKEHVGLAVAALGLWYARRRPRAGIAIAGAGAAVAALAVGIVIPGFRPEHGTDLAGRYDELGLSSLGLRDLRYLLAVLLPLAGLPLLAPLLALAAVPELALNILSEAATQTSIRYHYSSVAVAPLVAAAILGGRRFGGIALLAAAVAALAIGPLPRLDRLRRDAQDEAAAAALRVIGEDAAVSATNGLGAHLSRRRRILLFPLVADADVVAIEEGRPAFGGGVSERTLAAAVAGLRRDRRFRLVYERDGVLLFRRESSGGGDTP